MIHEKAMAAISRTEELLDHISARYAGVEHRLSEGGYTGLESDVQASPTDPANDLDYLHRKSAALPVLWETLTATFYLFTDF